MKNFKNQFLLFVLIMIAVLVIFWNAGSKFEFSRRNITYYNDQMHRIEEEYLNGVSEETLEEEYDCRIVLSKRLDDPELAELYGLRAFVLDFTPEGEYLGKVAWLDDYNSYHRNRNEYFRIALTVWIVLFILGSLLFIYLYISSVKPLDDLIRFSRKISKGNFDEPLPMNKNIMFESFAEALDIMREELKESRMREAEGEKARKELITQLSHDIKTPLSIIKATSEVLEIKLKRKDDENDPELKENLEKLRLISQKTDLVSALMTNVMHSTLDELEHIDVNVTEENSVLIEDMLVSLKNYGNIILDDHISPCLIYMDKIRMEQVIDNIVGNSYKYAKTDIHVRFGQTEEIMMPDGTKGVFVKTVIHDSGPGVSEDDLPLLSEKYYRGKNASHIGGYGLGMYLVRLYMEKQGGGMEYYNDNGFTVELLLKKV